MNLKRAICRNMQRYQNILICGEHLASVSSIDSVESYLSVELGFNAYSEYTILY